MRAPFLKGKPVGVLGNQGACVIAKSYEMKAAGVKTGTPIWDALALCPQGVRTNMLMQDPDNFLVEGSVSVEQVADAGRELRDRRHASKPSGAERWHAGSVDPQRNACRFMLGHLLQRRVRKPSEQRQMDTLLSGVPGPNGFHDSESRHGAMLFCRWL